MMTTIQVGKVKVFLDPAYAYQRSKIWFNGYPISRQGDDFGESWWSANGVVLEEVGAPDFVGGRHGGEVLNNATLTVDGVATPITGDIVGTSEAIFSRETNIGGAVTLTHVQTIANDEINETFTCVKTNAAFDIKTFYASLQSYANTLSRALPVEYNGKPGEVQDSINQTAINYMYFDNRTREVIQYDPTTRLGVKTAISYNGDQRINSFITDRAWDNKLYFRVRDMEGTGTPSVTVTQKVSFIEYPIYINSLVSENRKLHDHPTP